MLPCGAGNASDANEEDEGAAEEDEGAAAAPAMTGCVSLALQHLPIGAQRPVFWLACSC